jgi:3-hydroxybutyryl-CoA dehydratase
MTERKTTLAEMTVGDVHTSDHPVTDTMIRAFAEATGDRNPLHLDEAFAATTMFGRRIAHGMLTAGILSGVLGMEYPGMGTIYLSQSLQFRRPVFIDDMITVRLEVLEVIPEKNRVRLGTTCANQDGVDVLVGEALVMPPKE